MLAHERLRARMRALDAKNIQGNRIELAGAPRSQCALLSSTGRVLATHPAGWLPVGRLRIPAGTRDCGATIALPGGRIATVELLEDGYLLRSFGAGGSTAAAGPDRLTQRALRLSVLGVGQPTATLDGCEVRLTPRQADILTILALHPNGMSAEQLAVDLYGDAGNAVTVRAEMHRLRKRLGSAVVQSRPYRLCEQLEADFLDVRNAVRAGDLTSAVRTYSGELRPGSEAPFVVEERALLGAALRNAVLSRREIESMWLLGSTELGAGDLDLAERLVAAMPKSDARRFEVMARAARLGADM